MDIERSIVSACTDKTSLMAFIDAGLSSQNFADPDYGAKFDYAVEIFKVHNGFNNPPLIDQLKHKFNDFPDEGPIAAASYLIEQQKELEAKRLGNMALLSVRDTMQSDPIGSISQIHKDFSHISSILEYSPDEISSKGSVDIQIDKAKKALLEQCEGVPTPWGCMTQHSNGIRPGELWIAAAESGKGKSWLACQFFLSAIKKGWHTYFATLEMDEPTMLQRLQFIWDPSIPPFDYVNGVNSSRYQPLMDDAMKQIYQQPGQWFICSPQDTSVEAIFAAAHAKHCNFLIIDQLQFLQRPKGFSRTEQIEAIVRTIKREAKRYKIAVLLVSQITRAAIKEDYHIPRKEDLAQSASLEQAADAVITMGRTQEMGHNNLMDICFAKGRRFPEKAWRLNWETKNTEKFEVAKDDRGQDFVVKRW